MPRYQAHNYQDQSGCEACWEMTLSQTVISVGFIDPKFTNAGLERLESIGLPKLRYFGFGGTQITDAGLEHLKAFSKLQFGP